MGPEAWSWGGGTALAYHVAHRDSEDIDIFLPDIQLLGRVSPRLNDVAARLGSEYDEKSNMVKIYAEAGQIDFIVSAPLTSAPAKRTKAWGLDLFLETPAEIGAKKIFHRGDRLLPRDIFDLAVIIDRFSADLLRESSCFDDRLDAAILRLEAIRKEYPARAADLAIRPGFERLRDEAVDIVSSFFSRLEECRPS